MSVNLGNDTKATSPVRTPDEAKESKYEPKQNKKIVRLLTVVAYVISVSMAAIILSLYYVFLWDPQLKYTASSSSSTHSETHHPDTEVPELNTSLFSDGSGGDKIAAADQSNVVEPAEPKPMALPIFQETRNHHLNSHHSHHSGQTAQSNNNHQSSGPSPQQGGMARDTSSPEVPFMPEESRQHHHQKQHGQPPLSASA